MLLWLIAVVIALIGVVQLFQGQVLFALVLFVIACLIGPGGYSIFRGRSPQYLSGNSEHHRSSRKRYEVARHHPRPVAGCLRHGAPIDPRAPRARLTPTTANHAPRPRCAKPTSQPNAPNAAAAATTDATATTRAARLPAPRTPVAIQLAAPSAERGTRGS